MFIYFKPEQVEEQMRQRRPITQPSVPQRKQNMHKVIYKAQKLLKKISQLIISLLKKKMVFSH